MDRTYKKEVWTLAAVSAMLALTFFVFAPLQMYIGNLSECWFSMGDVLVPSLIVGVIMGVLCFLFGLMLKEKVLPYYICLLIGVGVALFIQGNFVRTDYGVLNGQAIEWEKYAQTARWNTLMWVGIVLLPFAVKLIFKKVYRFWFTMVSGGVVLIQLILLIFMGITVGVTPDIDEYYLSNEGLYTVSDEQNVLVFILDTFDQNTFEEVRAEDPAFLEQLDGFTYFENMTSAYPTTRGSLPFILTGKYYRNEQYFKDYLKEAFEETDFYRTLDDAGYDIGIYTSDSYVPDSVKAEYADNAEQSRIVVSSHKKLEAYMLRFTAFQYFPHVVKKYFWFDSSVFSNLQTVESRGGVVFQDGDLAFYAGLNEGGLTLTGDGKRYDLIHLEGMHPPADINEDLVKVEANSVPYTQKCKAMLKIVYAYLDELKRLGVYDDSLIILTGDHGIQGSITTPVMLAKGFGDRGALRVSDSPVSHANLFGTVMTELSLDPDGKYGPPLFDVGPDDDAERYYYKYISTDTDPLGISLNYLPSMIEYTVSPGGNDLAHFSRTGNIYTSDGLVQRMPYEYHPGDMILFTAEDMGTEYFVNGISGIEVDYAWSMGKTAQILLEIGDVTDDLCGEFTFKWIYTGSQRMIIKSDGKTLYEAVVTDAEKPLVFSIPAECVHNGKLVLDLEYPDAVSPSSRGESNDNRDLAFAFTSMRFYEAK